MKKVILHLHLDGSLRPETIFELANEGNIKLPADNVEDLKKYLMVGDNNADLKEYLQKFELPLKVMQNRFNLNRIAYELVEDLYKEGVIYAEIRFAPTLHTNEGLSMDEVIKAVMAGINKANLKYGIECRILLCALRHMSVEDAMPLIDLAKKYKSLGVVGLDLAGNEKDFPVEIFTKFFNQAKELEIPFTIHAGEADGAKSVYNAIELGAKRIGHGVRAMEDENLLSIIKEKEIVLEFCPISNIQTNVLENFDNYPIKKFLEMGIKVSLNSDNRTVSNTNYDKERALLKEKFGFTDIDIKKLNKNAIFGAFIDMADKEKLMKKLED